MLARLVNLSIDKYEIIVGALFCIEETISRYGKTVDVVLVLFLFFLLLLGGGLVKFVLFIRRFFLLFVLDFFFGLSELDGRHVVLVNLTLDAGALFSDQFDGANFDGRMVRRKKLAIVVREVNV